MTGIKIAIAGELRSGKTTLENYAVDKYGVVPFAFADELKRDFHFCYPHIHRNPKPRKGYQLFGQLMRFLYGEGFWVDKCFSKIEDVRQAAENYNITGSEAEFIPLITDLRQPNEFERCRKEGYTIIKVVAPTGVRIKRAKLAGDNFSVEDLNHESETFIKDAYADYTIVNQGSLEELYAKFDKIMSNMQTKLKSQDTDTVIEQISGFYNTGGNR